MVGHVKSRVLAHRLDLRDELADVSFLDERIGQSDVERNGNSVIRDRIVAFLLHDFNEKIVLRENYIITAEAKGIPLAHEMARQAGDAKYFVARKGSKLYMRDTFGVAVRSITTDREQHLYLDGADAKLINGKRVLILDDVISTGESLSALEALVEKAGGIICGRMAILAEGDAQKRDDIIYLEPLPLFNPDGTVKA